MVLDAEDCCCFPLERSLLPLQKSLETLKSSQGHFHTRGYCIHRMRQLLLDESGMSLATVKVWGEIHMSQLVLAPTRPGQGKARLTDVCVGLLSTQKLFSCASTFSYFERKPKSWRIWEIPLAMPLFCISPVLGSLEDSFLS